MNYYADYMQTEVKPKVHERVEKRKEFRARRDDFYEVLDQQIDWDNLKNWDAIEMQYEQVDWDMLGTKIRAMDVRGKIDWDELNRRMEIAQDKITKKQEI